jgi:hypothetical protein
MRDARSRDEPSAAAVAAVARDLAELGVLPSRELARRHLELFGESTRSNNRDYLIRKLAWKIQENAFGGLTPRAHNRISELGDDVPHSWRRRAAEKLGVVRIPVLTRSAPASASSKKEVAAAAANRERPRDPRLPPVGSVLGRMYAGERHDVRVLDAGFEYQGKVFNSLSQVARAITGTAWNGFGFFGLGSPGEEAAASVPTPKRREPPRRRAPWAGPLRHLHPQVDVARA